tara:strand:+ start:285 stop:1061 length:777 start_codon:yes stop_codon:yes gene_type:complete
MTIKVHILGCGSSSGVPAIGNNWGNCDPKNPKNRRMRSSLLIEDSETTILIDATPDLRQQLLNANVKHIDGVLITHAHADHIHGIDDFRFLNLIMKKHIQLYASDEVIDQINKKFGYVFEDLKSEASGFYYKPCLIPNKIKNTFFINNLKIMTFKQDHGFGESTGYRINNIGYSTDVVNLENEAFRILEGIDLWIVDCLQLNPHKSHAHLEKTLSWIKRLKPKKAILTHMSILTDYEDLLSRLPNNCVPAYDGLIISV